MAVRDMFSMTGMAAQVFYVTITFLLCPPAFAVMRHGVMWNGGRDDVFFFRVHWISYEELGSPVLAGFVSPHAA